MSVSRPRLVWRSLSVLAVGAALYGSVLAVDPTAQVPSGAGSGDHWVGTWATAVVARPALGAVAGLAGFGPAPGPPSSAAGNQPLSASPPQTVTTAAPVPSGGRGAGPPPSFSNQTLRQIVHTSIGGERVRVVFSNAFGVVPLEIGRAQIALRDKPAADGTSAGSVGSSIVAASGHPLTFGGSASATIRPGAVLVSDPVAFTVPAQADLAIDVHLPGDTTASGSPITMHIGAQQTNFVSPAGDYVGQTDFPIMTTTQSWFFLARVEVTAPEQVGAIVTFGDSITDGTRSSMDANNRWPDQFARRLAAQNIKLGVLNEGIAGNRVLADGAGVSALARFDRDVLVQTGATHVIVLESINDIGLARSNPTPTVADLIAGHRQLIERAHARGLKIFGATLTPFAGAAYWTSEGEAKRQGVNEWIRTGKAYDGVIDFDAAVRDPNAPTKLLPEYNPGDNLHMNDAGYQAMANAVDLALFKGASRSTRQ
jgi:lysophospholipase L1-like esterase